jgi:hypothetical protein
MIHYLQGENMPNDQIAHGCDNFMSWYEVSGGGGYVTMTSHCGSYVKEAEYRFGGAVNPYYKGAYYQRFCVDCEGKEQDRLRREDIAFMGGVRQYTYDDPD